MHNHTMKARLMGACSGDEQFKGEEADVGTARDWLSRTNAWDHIGRYTFPDDMTDANEQTNLGINIHEDMTRKYSFW